MRARAVSAAVLLSIAVGKASLADPLNSSDRPVDAGASGERGPHNEFNLVPVGGGTTDIGIGGGYFLGFDAVAPGKAPYVWNLESAGFITFAERPGVGLVVPYQDAYVALTVPRLLVPTLEFMLRAEYSWETTLGYYGLGDASLSSIPAGATNRYFEYGRLHPELYLQLRCRIVDHVIARTGVRYIRNWLQIASNSKLQEDLSAGSPEVKSLLGSTGTSNVALFDYGLQFDNRDSMVSAHSGMFDALDVQVSPGNTSWAPYRYIETTVDMRLFVPIWAPRIILAGRLVGDLLYGEPPFYELARFEDTYAIGGLNGVRGVPAQRYYGKVKVLGNLELRTELATFHALGKPVTFGVTAFLDGGRVWADTSIHPELDGSGAGLKYGAGGGLRFQSGSAFVLRADVAWSPDATPIAGYVAAGQMF